MEFSHRSRWIDELDPILFQVVFIPKSLKTGMTIGISKAGR